MTPVELPNVGDWLPEPLGWWAISGDAFLSALRRAANGEEPDLIYAEQYSNADTERVDPT